MNKQLFVIVSIFVFLLVTVLIFAISYKSKKRLNYVINSEYSGLIIKKGAENYEQHGGNVYILILRCIVSPRC